MLDPQAERLRDARYPISRWYVRPIAGWAARWLSGTWVRPSHLTALGAMMAVAAVAILCATPEYTPLAAIPVWLAWFYDRADGMLARRQGTASAWGAWFDANVDELVDLALQVAVTVALAWQVDASWPWFLLVAFLGGKYLLMYGLAVEEQRESELARSPATGSTEELIHANENRNTRGQACQSCSDPPLTEEGNARGRSGGYYPLPLTRGMLHGLYHLPGNCDVRVHWLILMLLLNQLAVELAAVALYYNLRWIVRYALVWRRLRREG